MDEKKPDIEWKRLFLAIIFTLGGVISILVPASKLDGQSISRIIAGIPLIMLGEYYFWESTEEIRKSKKMGPR